jgi:hypothetical protein
LIASRKTTDRAVADGDQERLGANRRHPEDALNGLFEEVRIAQ